MRSFLLVAATILLPSLVVPPAHAQDVYNCSDFTYQEDAQAVLDADRSGPHRLDGNSRNGIGCEGR